MFEYVRWEGRVLQQKKRAVSAAASMGTRYKLSALQDLMLDVRFQCAAQIGLMV
jgi:hypothetical protein